MFVQLFIISFLLFLLTRAQLFALLSFIALVLWFLKDIQAGVKDKGWVKELVDNVKGLGHVVFVFGMLSLLLGSSVPISVVASCSMKPSLEQGDLIIVKKFDNSSVPVFTLSPQQFDELLSANLTPYFNGTPLNVSGSVYSHCLFHSNDGICQRFFVNPLTFSDRLGLVVFHYSLCTRVFEDGRVMPVPCVVGVDVLNNSVNLTNERPVVVYAPKSSDYFSLIGDIIHRVQFMVTDGRRTLLFTKGDNNEVFDVQLYDERVGKGNSPVLMKQVKGEVWFSVPVIGYVKLIASGIWQRFYQCKYVVIGWQHVG
jgi:signal peptidase I